MGAANRSPCNPEVDGPLRLTLLVPDLVRAIDAGQQPRCMRLLWFQRNPLPMAWVAQRGVVE